jgi:hypothetical protein
MHMTPEEKALARAEWLREKEEIAVSTIIRHKKGLIAVRNKRYATDSVYRENRKAVTLAAYYRRMANPAFVENERLRQREAYRKSKLNQTLG